MGTTNERRTNKGKKYIRLTGAEVATPENELRAREYLQWYADNPGLIYDRIYDGDLATETLLRVYDAIAFKGVVIENRKGYFLRAYNLARAAKAEKGDINNADDDYLDTLFSEGDESAELHAAQLEAEAIIMRYVEGRYNSTDLILFQMYVQLSPGISYEKLAGIFGMPLYKMWAAIGVIKKDVRLNLGAEIAGLLSIGE